MKTRILVVALTLVIAMVVTAISPLTFRAAAQPSGPWLDEVVISQELDSSLALTKIIEGEADGMFFDFRNLADRERALAADNVETFTTYGLFDEFTMNPAVQSVGPENPFAIRAVRESMQYLIDRDFIVREIYGGRSTVYRTPFHPLSPDYARGIADFLVIEDQYAFDPAKGKQQMFAALEGAGWTIGTDGFWHDSNGDLVVITGLIRTQDERLQMGRYYSDLLRGLNFNVVNNEGPRVSSVAYGGLPDQNLWHFYTAGWISTSLTAWDDGQLDFFANCGIGEPYCNVDFYQPPAELSDIAQRLLVADYGSLAERAQLIKDGTAMAMSESIRIFIDARSSLWASNTHMSNIIWDLFGGDANPWALRAADTTDSQGNKTAKMLNLEMLIDGWNPWVYPGWLYDSVQRNLMFDDGMDPHPHTGRWVDWRQHATVVTQGPTGTLNVPSDAIAWDNGTNSFAAVGSGVTASSKVTYDMDMGMWHHGVDLTMADIVYGWSNAWRRCIGDIDATEGITLACNPALRAFVDQNLVAIKPVDDDTIEVYMNYWHIDQQEIAASGSGFPTVPWEVGELATKLLLDKRAVTADGDIPATGREWLDLTKGASLGFLVTAMANYTAANEIPPGMGTWISSADATERWTAINDWYTAHGHFWPSQGPFFLDTIDVPNLQTVFKAFRTGYPYNADYYDAMTVVAQPRISFAPTPPVVFAGTPAIFDFSATVGPAPTDDFTSQWFLRDSSTGEFISEGVPSRLGAGSYRIEIPASQTDQLLLGNFEIISVAVGNRAAIPSIVRTTFLVLPSTDWFEALLDARASLLQSDIDSLTDSLTTNTADIDSVQAATSGLVALITAMTILAVIAIGVAVVSVILVLRRKGGT